MITVKAQYRPASVPGHRNNPLIEALPDYLEWRPADVLRKLAKVPSMPNELATRSQNTSWLSELPSNLFIPTKRHYALFETVDLLIRQGYSLRNPISSERAEYIREAYARMQNGEAVTDGTFETETHEQLTASLIGTSGLGKTRTVERILTLYPQLIEHERTLMGGPFLQITYLHVECPHDGSVIALCRNILAEIDRLTGNDYRRNFKITDRTTLETLRSTLVHVLAVHYVGIIVIDEIQNLTSSRKNREDLFNFIVSLSNSLNVPLLFVGTPRIYSFLTSNMRTARRFGTRGFINWKPLAQDSREWKSFIAELWKYNRVQQTQETMPQAIEDKLYEKSCGIVEVLLKLYILAQIRVLLLSSRKEPTATALTPEILDHIFEEYFQNLKPVLDKVRRGDADALLKLEDIVMPQGLESLISEMKLDLEGSEALSESELREKDVAVAITGSMEFSGDSLPPVVSEIANSLVKGSSE